MSNLSYFASRTPSAMFSKSQKTAAATQFTFLLALALLFMVLASQFNSFMQPFYIMLAVPLGIVGGIAALWLSGYTLNIYSGIGLVLLIGLVAKNSILLVDLTNQRREQGMNVNDALRDACPIRMRPVVMTSLTIILALAPAAIGVGAGAETNAPLSLAAPVRPAITLVSTYTGYTGSGRAIFAAAEKISWMLPLSHLLPSDTKTSSGDTAAPRAL